MYRVRLFVLWVMMIAVPFQGYAAVAMVFCGPDHGGAPAAATAAAEHKHGDGHADQHHAKAQDEAKQSAGHGADKTASAEPDAMHKCSTCGTCGACHGTALISTLEFPVLHGLPRADLAEPPFAMATLAPRVLDKPPRA